MEVIVIGLLIGLALSVRWDRSETAQENPGCANAALLWIVAAVGFMALLTMWAAVVEVTGVIP